MLQLILGSAGSGKTYYLRQLLSRLARENEGKIMLIVPEQYSFESERALLDILGEVLAQRVEVLSFARLSDRIYREYGRLRGTPLEEGGRQVLMSLALKTVQDSLVLYKKPGLDLARALLLTVEEFKINGITPRQLSEAGEALKEGTLKQKLRETALIFEAYNALVEQIFADPADELTYLAETLEVFPFFQDYIVCFDAFYSFMQQELNIIARILDQAREVYITLCMPSLDTGEGSLGLFANVRETARRLMAISRERGILVAAPAVQNEQKRFNSPALRAIEKGIFRYDSRPWDCEDDSVCVIQAKSVYDECEVVAATIKNLVREQGLRYRDIAVIARSLEGYSGVIDAVFERFEVPFYMDTRQGVADKALMRLVTSALECVLSGFDADDLFMMLKTGLCGLNIEEVSDLENYALMWGISGGKFLADWTAHPEGFGREMTERDIEGLKYLNELRQRAVAPLLKLRDAVEGADGRGISRAVYLMLEDIGVSRQFYERAQALAQQGEIEAAEDCGRLWDELVKILDQMALTVGDTVIELKEYAELLAGYIKGCDLGHIPRGIDQVAVGGADRMRPCEPKVTFVIGANEGVFPASLSPVGLFAEQERRSLNELGLNLYMTLERRAIEERFMAYTALTSPSERLYITCPETDKSGQSLLPSVIVAQVERLLPKVRVIKGEDLPLLDKVAAPLPSFELAARLKGEEERERALLASTLIHYFGQIREYSGKIEALNRAADQSGTVFADSERAKRLFGEDIYISPSKVDSFYLCPFSYFCRYGLGARARRQAQLDPLEFGTMAHYALETVVKECKGNYREVSPDWMKRRVRELLEQYVDEKMGGFEDKPARFGYLFSRLVKTVAVLAARLMDELAVTAFVPVDFELEIGKEGSVPAVEIELPDGGRVYIEGKVDRVDVMKSGDKSYIRVVDYKTGTKDFKLFDVLFGLNMQMLIYLIALWKNGGQRYGDVVPAGVLYMPVKNKVVSIDRGTDKEAVQKERAKDLRMSGLVLEDREVVEGMGPAGVFIYQKVNKNGVISPADSVADLAEIGRLGKYIERLIVKMAESLRQGKIGAVPASGGYEPCAYCDYYTVCGFEKGGKTRPVYKVEREEIFKLIEQEKPFDKGGKEN